MCCAGELHRADLLHAMMRAGCCLDPYLCSHVGREASAISVGSTWVCGGESAQLLGFCAVFPIGPVSSRQVWQAGWKQLCILRTALVLLYWYSLRSPSRFRMHDPGIRQCSSMCRK